MSSNTQQFATFRLAEFWFGIDVLHVQEVLRHQEMTRVPLAAPAISGLINLRGQLVTAVDLRRLFELPDRPEGQLPMNVVTAVGQGLLSLVVDEISDVVTLEEGEFVAPPETVPPVARRLISRVFALKDRLLLIINTDSVSQLTLC